MQTRQHSTRKTTSRPFGLTGRARALVRTPLVLLALALAPGCSFEAADATRANMQANTCQDDDDCGAGARCQATLCVMQGTPAPLGITLEVTPKRMPDGSGGIPLPFGPFTLDGPTKRDFALPLPVVIAGSVRDAGAGVASELNFVPVSDTSRSVRTGRASTTENVLGEDDFSVALLPGVVYRVFVEPTDTSRPPYSFDFQVGDAARIDVDYTEIEWLERHFYVENVPEGRELSVRAIERDTRRPVSSSSRLNESGEATLLFAPGERAFRVEVSAMQMYAPGTPDLPAACDGEKPLFPTLRFGEEAMQESASGGDYTIALPDIPETLRYTGFVRPCSSESAKSPAGMPIALDATTLDLDLGTGTGTASVTVSYSVTTMASPDVDTGELRFCTRVLPGEYVVVITPPADLACEIFAERRSLVSETDAADVLLRLRTPAVLSGTLETPDMMPLANATIDAVALGRPEGVMLAEGDPSVPSYNRSKQAQSDEAGRFRLQVDVGSYDIILKPAPQSGFAWQVLYDVAIAARREDFATRVTLPSPVLVQGTLRYADASASASASRSLGGAEVHAFATAGEGTPTAHSVEIAHGVAGDDGSIMLLISPMLRQGGW